jgi:hypothetical protein
VVKLRSPCRVQLVKKASSHLRINPANAITSDREIGRMKRLRLHEFQDLPFSLRDQSRPEVFEPFRFTAVSYQLIEQAWCVAEQILDP